MSRTIAEWIGRTDDTRAPPRVRQRSICSVDGCERHVTGQGLCNMHYRRMRRHGDPLGGGTAHGNAESFLNAAIASETDACIIWPYGLSSGYGSINSEQFGTKYAHIYVCEKRHTAPSHPIFTSFAMHLSSATTAHVLIRAMFDGIRKRQIAKIL